MGAIMIRRACGTTQPEWRRAAVGVGGAGVTDGQPGRPAVKRRRA